VIALQRPLRDLCASSIGSRTEAAGCLGVLRQHVPGFPGRPSEGADSSRLLPDTQDFGGGDGGGGLGGPQAAMFNERSVSFPNRSGICCRDHGAALRGPPTALSPQNMNTIAENQLLIRSQVKVVILKIFLSINACKVTIYRRTS